MVVVIKNKKDVAEAKKNDRQHQPHKVFNAKKFCGLLKVSEDPQVIQQRLRDEWE
jgi:hypothetical protein